MKTHITDALGSVLATTRQDQSVEAAYSYSPYGETAQLGNDTSDNALQYTGRENDEGTGLYFYRARYYDPVIGRFVSRDPIGMLGGQNAYAYVSNHPVMAVDPLGLWEVSVEFYRPTGGGISFGRDPNTGQGFLSCKFGFGFGGGITYDSFGGRPGGEKAGPGTGGTTLGVSLDAGGTLGAAGYGVSGQASGSRGYDFGASRQYNDPSFKSNLGYSPGSRGGVSVGGSLTIQGSIYGPGTR